MRDTYTIFIDGEDTMMINWGLGLSSLGDALHEARALANDPKYDGKRISIHVCDEAYNVEEIILRERVSDESTMFTKTYQLAGIHPAPRDRMQSDILLGSFYCDWEGHNEKYPGIRIIDFKAEDDHGILRITRPTESDCDAELEEQLSSKGYFGAWIIDKVEAIVEP